MTVSSFLPAKIRGYIYSLFAAALAVEAIWDVVDEGVESRVVATMAALGFVMARANTSDV